MIQLPRRSVTRFFIPLVDVLTLIFCVFLILQAVRGPEVSAEPGGAPKLASLEEQKKELEALQLRLDLERRNLEELRKERGTLLQQRFAFRVLDIDAADGKLYANEPPKRIPIRTMAEARALIEQHQREARGRELFYVLMYPRQVTGYPQPGQIKEYDDWFAEVTHTFDNPRAR